MSHNNKELLRQVILAVSEAMGIDSGIIEKDYYGTIFLKELVKKQPQILSFSTG